MKRNILFFILSAFSIAMILYSISINKDRNYYKKLSEQLSKSKDSLNNELLIRQKEEDDNFARANEAYLKIKKEAEDLKKKDR